MSFLYVLFRPLKIMLRYQRVMEITKSEKKLVSAVKKQTKSVITFKEKVIVILVC
ncbi:hypothetical protein MACH07_21910 [Flagellimonas marinaquae]|uniref:Uncharacterized protein n=1 Tax=Flagellimonas marinaquae TaxID=254955 RepID=A0AA48HPL4_9FLAO|nr:hypothetical protein MACH07_21910 [Allomuricauda aquimarina]